MSCGSALTLLADLKKIVNWIKMGQISFFGIRRLYEGGIAHPVSIEVGGLKLAVKL